MTIHRLKPGEVREFGSSHALAAQMLLPAVIILLVGVAVVFVTTSFGIGLAPVGIGGGLLAVIAFRRAAAAVPAITVSSDGIVFRDVSSRMIPWREVRAVEIGSVREFSMPTSRRVVSVSVSRQFFATLSPKTLWPDEVVSIGDPTVIHIAYYRRDVPVDELADLIEAQRRA